MSDRPNAAIAGSLAEIKFIKSRSVCVLCVEIPIEQSEDAIAKFGVPIPGREIPIALALLQASPGPAPAVDSGPSTAPSFPKDAGVPARDTVKSERAKAAYKAMPPMKRDVADAARLIKDEAFQRWVLVADFRQDNPVGNIAWTDRLLKQHLRIASKAEIGESRDVNERWHTLLTTYQRDTGQLAEIRS
jgi:hypothetical protein